MYSTLDFMHKGLIAATRSQFVIDRFEIHRVGESDGFQGIGQIKGFDQFMHYRYTTSVSIPTRKSCFASASSEDHDVRGMVYLSADDKVW